MRMSHCASRAIKAVAMFTFIAGIMGAGAANSQAPATFEYFVKFVCGRAAGGQAGSLPVAPGYYYTAINVQNPSDGPMEFRKKFAIALPGEKAGKVSNQFGGALKGDEALEIDCPDILNHLELRVGQFAKGFAIIRSPRELNIVAVYTAATTPTGPVVTMEIERVPKRQ